MISDYIKGGLRVVVDRGRIRSIVDVKDRIESDFRVRLTINQEGGEVVLTPMENTTFEELMKAKNVIEAISYGFTYEEAQKLENDDYVLDVIDLRDYIDKDPGHMSRVKARIIGENGRAKRTIEEITETSIIIGDRVVAILGPYENVKAAKEALEMLIKGRQHSTVYRWLSNWRREVKYRELMRGVDKLLGGHGEGEDSEVG
ncbi:KH domain-containing protein [Vulcanisaeta thermophila]|uniref:KH domain-containing protein n=1 Tax=Vulcanisaeta thermophila TaxID=867917 RepID=UPI000852B9A8|nr:KH domain-containing protein [Vulcanisaeta thermophila]